MSETRTYTVKSAAERTDLLRTKFKGRLSDKFCPRCNTKTVDKPNRICRHCKGILLWQGDSATEANKNMQYWYMWYHSPITNIQGWVPKDYFVDTATIQ